MNKENQKNSNNEKSNNENNKYKAPTPRIYSEYDEETNQLIGYLKDDTVYNIGVVAPYGAGKSCVIKNYLNSLTDSQKKHICTISVANFKSILNNPKTKKDNLHSKMIEETEQVKPQHVDEKTKQEYDEDEIELCCNDMYNSNYSEQEIEKSVLQQIVYQNSSFAVSDSDYNYLESYKRIYITGAIFLAIFLFSILLVSLQFVIDNNPFYITSSIWRTWTCRCLFLIDMFIFGIVCRYFIKHKSLKRIKISEVEIEEKDSSSDWLNKNIDEIVYRFNKLKYKVVIIEDLDRFNNHLIFAKLKELCTLLNLNRKKGKEKITFIYAVKDSMFDDEEERSKFFDAIVSIIPSLTSSNSFKVLSDEVESRIGTNIIDKYLIDDVSSYIVNRRVVINIINDYKFYESKISNKNANLLFSLMVYKNVKPKEFEKMQEGNGIIAKEFGEVKKHIINALVESKKDEISKLKDKLNTLEKNIRDEKYNGMKELKFLLDGSVRDYYNNNISRNNNTKYFKIIDNITSFKDVKEMKINYISSNYFHSSNESTVLLSSVEEYCFDCKGYFYTQEKILTGRINAEKNDLLTRIEQLYDEIIKVSNYSYKELFDVEPKNFTINDGIERLLLVNGYINEDYINFLSNNNSRLNSSDKEIFESIKSKKEIDFNSELKDPDTIIYRLNPERFATKYVLNFNLLTRLLENKDNKFDNHIDNFKIFISKKENAETLIHLIATCERNRLEISHLLTLLLSIYPEIWNQIYFTYSSEKYFDDELLSIAIHSLESMFEKMNNEGSLSLYISNSTSFDLNGLNLHTFETISMQYIIKIKNLDRFIKKNLLDYIISHNCYEFSFENIKYILSCFYSNTNEDIFNKNYECILNTKNDNLIQNVYNNFREYVQLIYNKNYDYSLKQEIIESILLNEKIEVEDKEIIIINEKNKVRFNDSFGNDVFIILMNNNKLELSYNESELVHLKSIDEKAFIDFINKSNGLNAIGKNINSYNKQLKTFMISKCDLKDHYENIEDDSLSVLDFSNDSNIIIGLLNNNKIKFNINEINLISNESMRNAYINHFSHLISQNSKNYNSNILEVILNSNSLEKDDFDYIINSASTGVLSQILNNNKNVFEYVKDTTFKTLERLRWILIFLRTNDEGKLYILENMRPYMNGIKTPMTSNDFYNLTTEFIRKEIIESKGSRNFRNHYHRLLRKKSVTTVNEELY